MPLKTGNTVAVERRMDLASLFCMISRHGPAVALAVIAVISVVAGFIIYRTVRVKRRKATAAAAGGDNKNPGAPERDASVIREETHSSSAGSTDVSDEGSPDMKEDVVMIRSHLKLRHRPAAAAAAEETPPHYSPLQRDLHLPDYKQTTSDNTEEVADAWDSYEAAETLAEEANQSLQSDGVTEMVLEEAVHCLKGEDDDVINDMLEEFHNTDVCLKEPINDEKNREEEKVLKAECQEGEDVTIDDTTRQEERTLNNPTSLHQTPHISEDSGDDRLQDHTTTNDIESNSEEPVVDIEALCVDCFCCGEDEEFENPDGIDDRVIGRISPEEGKKDEGEDQFLDHQLIGQQDDAWATTSEQETKLPSTLQDDDEMDKATILVGDRDEDGVLAGEEDIVEDHLNVTAVKVDTPLPQFNQQDVEVEQKEEKCLLCYQEDGVLYDGHDQVEEKMLTGDNNIACNEEQKSSSAALSPALACSDSLVKINNHEEDLSGIANSSSDCQHPLKEEKTAVSFDEDTISSILRPEMPSHETENKPESNGNDTPVVSTVESNDDVYDLHSCKNQQNVQALRNEAFDEASIAAAPEILACRGDNIFTPNMAEVFNEAKITADPDTVENIPSIIVEEIASPHLPSICQDKEMEHVENNEASEEKIVTTADDADCTSSLKSDEPWIVNTKSDEPSSSQDQQSDQTKNEDLSQLTFCDSPEMIDDVNPPVCQIPFEQFAFRDNDISPAGVGEESGISSMTVSPDAGNEFDIISENMVLLVVDSELQSEGKTETQDNLYADDAAIAAIKVDTTGMVFGHSEQTDWTNNGQFSANEDMFGHEIEESYHRAMDQFMTQIADSITSITDELTKQTDVIDIVEIVEVKEKKAGVSVEKKEDAKADEKEEDYEKTEISIMEATMDHNEWIMDSNYQALPWMNLSVSSFSQKTNQLPAAECQCSSAGTDTISRDTDIPLSPEVKQIENPSIVDENTENNKKVVAVQPMPQNVNVTFRVHYFIQSPFQTVAVTGNQQELGNWKGFVPLERAKDGLWATVVSLPAESHVEWKFVVVDKGAVCRWEECGNRLLDTGCGDDLLVHRWWGLL